MLSKKKIILIITGKKSGNYSIIDKLGESFDIFFKSLPKDKTDKWNDFFSFLKQENKKTKPAKKWLAECEKWSKKFPIVQIIKQFSEWINIVLTQIKNIHKAKEYNFTFFDDNNLDIVRGIIWFIGKINPQKKSPRHSAFRADSLNFYIYLIKRANNKLERINDLFEKSSLPEKVDIEAANSLLIEIREKYY